MLPTQSRSSCNRSRRFWPGRDEPGHDRSGCQLVGAGQPRATSTGYSCDRAPSPTLFFAKKGVMCAKLGPTMTGRGLNEVPDSLGSLRACCTDRERSPIRSRCHQQPCRSELAQRLSASALDQRGAGWPGSLRQPGQPRYSAGVQRVPQQSARSDSRFDRTRCSRPAQRHYAGHQVHVLRCNNPPDSLI
jgi:hypothetical protein